MLNHACKDSTYDSLGRRSVKGRCATSIQELCAQGTPAVGSDMPLTLRCPMQLERNRFWLKKVIEQVQEEPENKASGMYQVRSVLR